MVCRLAAAGTGLCVCAELLAGAISTFETGVSNTATHQSHFWSCPVTVGSSRPCNRADTLRERRACCRVCWRSVTGRLPRLSREGHHRLSYGGQAGLTATGCEA